MFRLTDSHSPRFIADHQSITIKVGDDWNSLRGKQYQLLLNEELQLRPRKVLITFDGTRQVTKEMINFAMTISSFAKRYAQTTTCTIPPLLLPSTSLAIFHDDCVELSIN